MCIKKWNGTKLADVVDGVCVMEWKGIGMAQEKVGVCEEKGGGRRDGSQSGEKVSRRKDKKEDG